MPPSTAAPHIMARKEDQTEPKTMAKHETNGKSVASESLMVGFYCCIFLTFFSADLKSQSITSTSSLDENTINATTLSHKPIKIRLKNTRPSATTIKIRLKNTRPSATTIKLRLKNTRPRPKATETPGKTVSLGDLPLELLYMIFDYAACRDHLKDPHYLIRLKESRDSDYEMVISQPALLMVCTSLRFALSAHFYSSCSFHVKVDTRWMLEGSANSLTVQQLENKLPIPLRLCTVKLTIVISELSKQRFDCSILVELGKKLFDMYRTTELNSKDGTQFMSLHWRLVCTDPLCNFYRFEDDLQLLLEEIDGFARSESLRSYDLQRFGFLLRYWLEYDTYGRNRTRRVRTALRDSPRRLTRGSQQSAFRYHYYYC
jgi:hypothetical protein